MIEKLIVIQNVGKFVSCKAQGDVAFRRLTLIYGENGHGKTTLTSVLHSLQSGDIQHVLERRTLGQSASPVVELLLDGSKTSFRGNKWSSLCSTLEVFDAHFIEENVYSGASIEHGHKKNLYRVIVGEKGVKLARKVEDLDTDIKDVNGEIATARAKVVALIPEGKDDDVEQFIGLVPVANVDDLISSAESELAALKRADEIRAKELLNPVALPEVPEELSGLLGKQVADLSSSVEKLVLEHVTRCMDERGQGWITQGLDYIDDDDRCPFCGRSIGGVDLISAYRSFFGEGYRQLKNEIQDLLRRAGLAFGEATLRGVERTIDKNEALADFWRSFVPLPPSPVLGADIQATWMGLRQVMQGYLEQKMAAPLEPLHLGTDFDQKLTEYAQLHNGFTSCNQWIADANEIIAKKKAATEKGNTAEVKARQQSLRRAKARHEPQAIERCEEYSKLIGRKKEREQEKTKAKKALDGYVHGMIDKYQEAINGYLDQFNTGFRIANAKRSYVGGTPNTSFQILINGSPVDVGDAKTPPGSPCFANTLSSGDKSALAFAFFLAKLDQDAQLANKIVVIDDPITSQDNFRASRTRYLVCELATKAAQVVVLSHDAFFLRRMWDTSPKGLSKPLKIVRSGEGSMLSEWDVEIETQSEYFQNYFALREYLEKGPAVGDLRHIARCIRPLLEENLRLRFPHSFCSNEWLGDFIDKIRQAPPGSAPAIAQPLLPEITAINDYSKKYHHGTNPGANTEPITDTELQGFVKNTLALIGSLFAK